MFNRLLRNFLSAISPANTASRSKRDNHNSLRNSTSCSAILLSPLQSSHSDRLADPRIARIPSYRLPSIDHQFPHLRHRFSLFLGRLHKFHMHPVLHAVTLQRGDSLWKLAQLNLGEGFRWRELLAVNPEIVNPSQIEVGAQLYVPARSSVPGVTSQISVRTGDTLWKIAQTTFGRGAFWPCIVQANPLIHDANQIYVGQELTLPGRCRPFPIETSQFSDNRNAGKTASGKNFRTENVSAP